MKCIVAGCESPGIARSMCNRHHKRWRRYGSPTGGSDRCDLPMPAYFWHHVNRDGRTMVHMADHCWEWTGGLDPSGYGIIGIKTEAERRAHRASYLMEVGPIPAGIMVLHECDNRLCVRPSHLHLGDHQLNSDEMHDRGRFVRLVGERVGNARLTEDRVREVLASAEPTTVVARRLGVSPSCIRDIRKGRSWTHVAVHVGGAA